MLSDIRRICALNGQNVDTDIKFVAINSEYYLHPSDFFSLSRAPTLFQFKENANPASAGYKIGEPDAFRIVFNDWSMMKYHDCGDDFFSGWIYVPRLIRPAKRWYIHHPVGAGAHRSQALASSPKEHQA